MRGLTFPQVDVLLKTWKKVPTQADSLGAIRAVMMAYFGIDDEETEPANEPRKADDWEKDWLAKELRKNSWLGQPLFKGLERCLKQ